MPDKYLKTLKLFLEANPDIFNKTIGQKSAEIDKLIAQIKKNHLDINEVDDEGYSAIHYSIKIGSTKLFEHLFAKSALTNKKTYKFSVRELSAILGHKDILIHQKSESKDPQISLYQAKRGGNLLHAIFFAEAWNIDDSVEVWKKDFVVPDKKLIENKLDITKTIISKYGAKCSPKAFDNFGFNAMHLACTFEYYDIAKYYFSIAGHNDLITIPQNSGLCQTPAHIVFNNAISRNAKVQSEPSLQFLAFLAENGDNFRTKDSSKKSIIDYAVESDNLFIKEFIILKIKNPEIDIAQYIFRNYGIEKLIDYLLQKNIMMEPLYKSSSDDKKTLFDDLCEAADPMLFRKMIENKLVALRSESSWHFFIDQFINRNKDNIKFVKEVIDELLKIEIEEIKDDISNHFKYFLEEHLSLIKLKKHSEIVEYLCSKVELPADTKDRVEILTDLMDLINKNDVSGVVDIVDGLKDLRERKSLINSEYDEVYPIYLAFFYGNQEMIEKLIDYGADVNGKISNILSIVFTRNDQKIFSFFLETYRKELMDKDIECEVLECIAEKIEHDSTLINIDSFNQLRSQQQNKFLEQIEKGKFKRDDSEISNILFAVSNNFTELLGYLITKPAERINCESKNQVTACFHKAAIFNNIKIFNLLFETWQLYLQKSPDIFKRPPKYFSKSDNDNHFSLLMQMAKNDREEMFDKILVLENFENPLNLVSARNELHQLMDLIFISPKDDAEKLLKYYKKIVKLKGSKNLFSHSSDILLFVDESPLTIDNLEEIKPFKDKDSFLIGDKMGITPMNYEGQSMTKIGTPIKYAIMRKSNIFADLLNEINDTHLTNIESELLYASCVQGFFCSDLMVFGSKNNILNFDLGKCLQKAYKSANYLNVFILVFYGADPLAIDKLSIDDEQKKEDIDFLINFKKLVADNKKNSENFDIKFTKSDRGLASYAVKFIPTTDSSAFLLEQEDVSYQEDSVLMRSQMDCRTSNIDQAGQEQILSNLPILGSALDNINHALKKLETNKTLIFILDSKAITANNLDFLFRKKFREQEGETSAAISKSRVVKMENSKALGL